MLTIWNYHIVVLQARECFGVDSVAIEVHNAALSRTSTKSDTSVHLQPINITLNYFGNGLSEASMIMTRGGTTNRYGDISLFFSMRYENQYLTPNIDILMNTIKCSK